MRKKHIIPALLLICSTLSVPVPAKAGIGSWFTWKTATVVSVAAAAVIPSVRNRIIFGSGWIYSGILKTREYFTNRKLGQLDQKVENGFSEQKDGMATLTNKLEAVRALFNNLYKKINDIDSKIDTIGECVTTKDGLEQTEFRLKQFIKGLF